MLNIMLIEDSPEDFELIQEMLNFSSNNMIKRTDRLSSGLKLLKEDTFDVVLLDLGLPDSVGLDGLVQIRDQESELPIIVLTGLSDETLAAKAIALGAQDYLIKGKFDSDSLDRAVRYSIERQRLEAERKKLTDAVPAFISHIDANFRYVFVNQTYERWFGQKQENIIGKHVREVLGETAWQRVCPYMERALSGEQVFYEEELLYQRGGPRWVHVSYTPDCDDRGKVRGFIGLGQDISWSKRAEKEKELAVAFLRLVNESGNKKEMIRSAVTFFRQHTGCEAVGVRLYEECDYPYYEARGFPEEFVVAENSLCARSDTGEVILDSTGDPVLDCMCGNVICGRFDPSKPFFTKSGSFWTNSTTGLLASTTESDRQTRTRNRCNGEGYESVALIALRVGDDQLGLLQLNDSRKGRFAPEDIALWERLTGYLSVALAKLRIDEELQKSEERYKRLVQLAPIPLSFVDESGKISYVNDRFIQVFGYCQDDLPNLTEWWQRAYPDEQYRRWAIEAWHAAARRASETNTDIEPTVCHVTCKDGAVRVVVISGIPMGDAFLVTFMDITERSRAEEALREGEEKFSKSFHGAPIMMAISKIEDGTYIDVNDTFLEWGGFRREEVIGKTSIEIGWLRQEDRDRLIKELNETGRIAGSDLTLFTKDGQPINCFNQGEIITIQGRKRLLSIAVDISEREKAQEALRESEERLNIALAASKMGVWEWDLHNDSFLWSANVCVW